MAAGVSQKLTKSLYSERGLRKLLQGLGDAAAGSGYAAIFCNRVTQKRALVSFRFEIGDRCACGCGTCENAGAAVDDSGAQHGPLQEFVTKIQWCMAER